MRGRSSAGHRVPNMAAFAGHVSPCCRLWTHNSSHGRLHSLRMSTHFLCVEVPPRSSRSLLEITARLPAATHRSSPHSPFPSSAPQLASPHSPRPACRSSSSALVVSPSLSLALSCMSVSPSRGSRRLSLPLALVGSRRPSLSLSRPHASPGCPAAPRQLCCPLMRVSAGAGRSSGSGT